MSRIPRRLIRSCKLCQGQLQLIERHTLNDLLHYLAPLAVLGALIVYSRFAKRKKGAKVYLLDDDGCWWVSHHVVVANMTKKRAEGFPLAHSYCLYVNQAYLVLQ